MRLSARLSGLSLAIYSHPTGDRAALALLSYMVTRFWSRRSLAHAAGVTRHYRLGVLGEPTRCICALLVIATIPANGSEASQHPLLAHGSERGKVVHIIVNRLVNLFFMRASFFRLY